MGGIQRESLGSASNVYKGLEYRPTNNRQSAQIEKESRVHNK